MGDLQQEIGALLDETSESVESQEGSEHEAGGNKRTSASTESREDRVEDQNSGSEAEGSEVGSSEEQSEENSKEESGTSEEGEESSEELESKEDSEEDPRDAQIRKLQEEVNRLSGQTQESSQESSESSTESSESDSESSAASKIDPLGDYDFDEIMESKDKFAEWAKKFGEKIESKAHEKILRQLPETIHPYVQNQVEIKRQADQFYSTNPELVNHKQYVSRVANEVAAEHPDWQFNDVLDETAKRARETLGLKGQAQENDSSSSSSQTKSPAFAKGSGKSSSKKRGGSSEKEQLSEVEKEIQDLLE